LAAGLPIRRKTLEQAGAAIADRVLLGLAAFLTGVMLGRAGSKAEFGAYMLGMTLVSLAVALQESLISAPYTVNCRDPSISPKRFLGGAFCHLLLLAGLITGVMVIAALLAAALNFGSLATFVTLALIVPCILVREFARRINYAELKPRSAVLLSGGVAVLQLGLALVLWMAGWLNSDTCLGVIGLASLGGAITWYLGSRHEMEFDRPAVRDAFVLNWPIARWIFATQISEILRVQIFPWLVALLADTATAGLYGACMAVAALASPLLIALSNIMVPQIVREEEQGGVEAVQLYVRRATIWMVLCMGAYAALLCTVSGAIVPWLYGPEFTGTGHTLVVLAISQVFLGLGVPSARALMALRRPDKVFWAQLISFAITLALSVPLIAWLGAVGAAYAFAVGAAVKLVATSWAYNGVVRSRRQLAGVAAHAAGKGQEEPRRERDVWAGRPAAGAHRFDAELARKAEAVLGAAGEAPA
jgi:O-antigen/teichoic acid export membrane protein